MEKEFKKDKEMQEHIDDYAQLWDKSSELSQYDQIDVDRDWRMVRAKMGFATRSKKIPLRKYFLRISAILILAFGLAYFLNQVVNQMPDQTQTDYFEVVADSDSKDVTLPDGSVVTLNTEASIFYNDNFNNENRDIILEGEAFFDVARNEQIPFRVFVSNSTIEVLGTSFNIKTDKSKIHLSVVTGHVAFFETSNKENRVELVKDEEIVYHAKKQKFDTKMDIDLNNISWKTRKLEFRNMPIEQVFESVADYYNKDLIIKSANKNFTESFTGSFDDQSIEEIIDAIELGTQQKFVILINENQLVISD